MFSLNLILCLSTVLIISETNALGKNDEQLENRDSTTPLHYEDERDEDQIIIDGGNVAKITKYPFVVAILWDGWHSCGGSLVTPDWVLTAAQCLVQRNDLLDITRLSVVAGRDNVVDQSIDPNDLQVRRPTAVFVHSRYNSNSATLNHDVGLVKLDYGFPLGLRIQLTRLPTRALNPTLCTVLGWGETKVQRQIMPKSLSDSLRSKKRMFKYSYIESGTILHSVDLVIIPRGTCQAKLREEDKSITLDSSTVCGRVKERSQETCQIQGDLGGPLMCNGYQKGITSLGANCGRPSMPGVYTTVEKYLQWINNTILAYSKRNNSMMERGKPLNVVSTESTATSLIVGNIHLLEIVFIINSYFL